MVEIRVAVTDATGVHRLAWRLAGVLDRSSVSFDEPARWLAEVGVGSAKLSIGARSYTMVGPVPITSSP